MSNELDKQISERLHHYESAVDAEAIWDAVKPPRRRRPWFWLFLFFGGIGIAGGAWWMLAQSHKPNAYTETTELVSEKPVATEKNMANQTILNDQSTNKQQSIPKESNTEKSNLNPLSNEHLAQRKVVRRHSKGANEQTEQTLEQPKTSISSYPQQSNESLIDEGGEMDQGIDKRLNSDIINNTLSEQQKRETIALLIPNKAVQQQEKGTPLSTISLLDPIDQPLSTILGFLPDHAHELSDTINYHEEVIPPSRKRSPWSIQTDAAYLFINRELSGEDSLTNWINQRMATESVLEALNLDFSINYAFHDNWQLRIGLGYTQINTSFAYDYTTTKTDSIEGLQMLIFNVDNTVDSIYGPIGSYETTQRQLEIYNSFRQIELPILANYETRWGDLSLILEAGARFRLNRTWEGQIIGNDGEVVSLEDQAWYRNGLGVSLQASLQFGYALNNQLQARLGGTLRYSPTNFTNEEVGFDERYQLTGLQLGLRYHF